MFRLLPIQMHFQRDFFDCFRRTTSTEQGAWLTTDDATLPRSNRLRPVCPCEPKTIKSARHFRASSTISIRGWPSRTRDSILSPFRRNFVAFVFVNSTERFRISYVTLKRLRPRTQATMRIGIEAPFLSRPPTQFPTLRSLPLEFVQATRARAR